VLDVTATGVDVQTARKRAYDAVGRISWPGMQFRGDIAASGGGPEGLSAPAGGPELPR
jgi:phosphoribosylamine---glycine ligase